MNPCMLIKLIQAKDIEAASHQLILGLVQYGGAEYLFQLIILALLLATRSAVLLSP